MLSGFLFCESLNFLLWVGKPGDTCTWKTSTEFHAIFDHFYFFNFHYKIIIKMKFNENVYSFSLIPIRILHTWSKSALTGLTLQTCQLTLFKILLSAKVNILYLCLLYFLYLFEISNLFGPIFCECIDSWLTWLIPNLGFVIASLLTYFGIRSYHL